VLEHRPFVHLEWKVENRNNYQSPTLPEAEL
jgi:hypothetical protein